MVGGNANSNMKAGSNRYDSRVGREDGWLQTSASPSVSRFERWSRRMVCCALAFAGLAMLGALSGVNTVHGQTQGRQQPRKSAHAGKDKQQTDPYTRPKPTHPTGPQIPSANRFRGDIVFLEQADSLYRPAGVDEELQIVKGNVRFRQAGMWMYCDSAYYFPQKNSLDAFGHVKMQQGDTLFVYSDRLLYDGYSRFAKLRCGASQRQVVMENRDVTLTTDSLDYNIADDLGWYECGGQLEDSKNILTSVYGNYSPSTKDADFYHDVLLRSKDGKFRLVTDTLYYNTGTNLARIETPTVIESPNDTIHTSSGVYNTDTGEARLLGRSTVYHTDSLHRVTTLTGDSIVYDPVTRITRAYSFRDPNKLAAPMVITDTARKAKLIGGFGLYNDSTREAMATEYPLMMEFSRPDTLFMRADTIRTWIRNMRVPVRPAIADAAAMAMPDSLQQAAGDSLQQAAGETARQNAAVSVADSVSQVAADSIWKEFHLARAYPRARFFRKDIQGVSDTIIFTEYDSLLRLTRLPIVWSEERQAKGDTIIVHFNDSTADWASFPHKGMMMELVDEDFYNQLSADKMMIYLEDGGMHRLEGEGSVMTIFLPQENDSTYCRFVYAESSYLNIDMEKGELERLKMWPEVSGTVTPVNMVKGNQKLLPGARWLGNLRPRREWYGGTLRWADDLGEIPEELENYFRQTAP